MNIIGNIYNQPYNAPKACFKGRRQVNYLVGILKDNPMRTDELAEKGIFDGITEQELKSREVLDAFEKAKKIQ